MIEYTDELKMKGYMANALGIFYPSQVTIENKRGDTVMSGMVVFTFMCDIKNDLEKRIPEALVTVQPHSYSAVEILVSWRKGTQKCNIGQLISIGEITERPKLALHYIEKILKMKDEEDNKSRI